MISVPHPFTRQYADEWIAGHAWAFQRGEALHVAITVAGTAAVVGALELRSINAEHRNAELSCWIGLDYWRLGYAAEAASAVLRYGFEHLHLNRIAALQMVRNPAFGRAPAKIGMKREGLRRQCVRKWERFEDVVVMAILRHDWTASNARGEPSEQSGLGRENQ